MDNENKFWIALWGMVLAIVAFAILWFSLGARHEREVFAQMVKDGVDPQVAACAWDSRANPSPTCVILAHKK